MDDLQKIRAQLNEIDDRILADLAARRAVVHRVIETKATDNLPLRDVLREEQLLSRLIQKGRELGLDAHLVTRIFHEVIDDSVRFQQLFLLRGSEAPPSTAIRVAFQGIEGAYSHLAAQKFFARDSDRVVFIGHPTFADALHAVESGAFDFAFLPIENTTAGSVHEVYDLLLKTSLTIVGEEIFRVEHCLLGIEDVPLSSLRRVFSHWQALAQCRSFLNTLPHCQQVEHEDTALSARKIKEDGDPTQAAIASVDAARRYGLKILQRDLADHKANYTRFLVITREPTRVDPRIPAKTSLVVAVAHQEGALLSALSILHAHHLNMTKLESRPLVGSPFQYLFYLDFEGNIDSQDVQAALEELRAKASYLKILGSYPTENRGKTPPTPEAVAVTAIDSSLPSTPPVVSGEGPVGLARKGMRKTDSVIAIRAAKVGGPGVVVIAGPPRVTSREELLAAARLVKESGGAVLRASCFRTDAGSSRQPAQGFKSLELLVEAGREYDLPVATEVVDPADVPRVAESVDLLEIGGRNMQNSSLLRAVGRQSRPVLLKRGMSSTLEELLQSAEEILTHGNQQVILCERGIRTFETTFRNTLDLSAVPLLKKLSHLPVAVDPSHVSGGPDWVFPLALAAVAVGAQALILEVAAAGKPGEENGGALLAGDFAEFTRRLYQKP